MDAQWIHVRQHDRPRSPSTLSDGWEYQRPPPFEPNIPPLFEPNVPPPFEPSIPPPLMPNVPTPLTPNIPPPFDPNIPPIGWAAQSKRSKPESAHHYHRHQNPFGPTILPSSWTSQSTRSKPESANDHQDPLSLVPIPPHPSDTDDEDGSLFNMSSYSSISILDNDVTSELPGPEDHWASNIIYGSDLGCHRFAKKYQSTDASTCHGTNEETALPHLILGKFVQVAQFPIGLDGIAVNFYHRPTDLRAKILIIERDRSGYRNTYCTPLTVLKVNRSNSILELCRVRRNSMYSVWARLNFHLYERTEDMAFLNTSIYDPLADASVGMVLFYCTFIAMKNQDERPIVNPDLRDNFTELQTFGGESLEFAGVIRHGDMMNTLRLFTDLSSGVVRLQASELRGPMRDVPIWTMFVTRYSQDPDWAALEGRDVSFAAVRPPPYIFVEGYAPFRNQKGEYTLQFDSSRDARDFIVSWTGVCRRDKASSYDYRAYDNVLGRHDNGPDRYDDGPDRFGGVYRSVDGLDGSDDYPDRFDGVYRSDDGLD